MFEKCFEKGAVPSESDSCDQTRQGEYGEGVEKGRDRNKKLGNQSAQASKKDDDEPNGEEATKESPFSDHLTGSHLVNMLRFKTLITTVTLRILAMPRDADMTEVR